MTFKKRFVLVYETVDEKFKEQFGFKFRDITFLKLVDYLYVQKHASSLAATRILFGLAMLFDIPEERGGANMYERWGDPKMCHFPLFSFIQAVPMPYMVVVYALLWLGALGITLGYKYRISAVVFTVCYWYLFLIEKSYWNNHSYLFGLVGFLFIFTEADCYWSLDSYLEPKKFRETVPYWNYFILKYQFFILYFIAGVKKGSLEWLSSYSVQNLGAHWVFAPFRPVLTVEQIDYFIVHWFIFVFDLTIAFWMMWSRSRYVATIFCALFHLMNSRLFTIGMFPWVCLATMPLFYPFDWPILVFNFVKIYVESLKQKICTRMRNNNEDTATKKEDADDDDDNDDVFKKDEPLDESKNVHDIDDSMNTKGGTDVPLDTKNDVTETKDVTNNETNLNQDTMLQNDNRSTKYNNRDVAQRKKLTTALIVMYMTIQGFLPFSHFITKGYNNWTNGLYGYSWDMMVYTWDVHSVVVKVVDNEKNNHFFVDPNVFTPNDRWYKHGDMVRQYAMCLKDNFAKHSQEPHTNPAILSTNISIYVDVWCSMNGRFIQRMFDPHVDLLQAPWNPFQEITYLMPLLDEATQWRGTLKQIKKDVHSWNQHSDVLFFADFPGYDLEKFIPLELGNVTLTVLKGQVIFEPEVTKFQIGQSYKLTTGYPLKIDSGLFHTVLNHGTETAYYMYTFYNTTEAKVKKDNHIETKPKLPVFQEMYKRLNNITIFVNQIFQSIYQLFFRLPMFLV